jgi:general secretion pathway protein F
VKFRYQALQPDGRLVAGQIEAPSSRSAHRDLVRRGVQPTAISAAGQAAAAASRRRRRAGARDHLFVLKELHALVAGGVPLAEAVTALAEGGDHPSLAAPLGDLYGGLRRGERFSEAFQRAFPVFPAYVHRLIEAGELSGRLAESLADAAAETEQNARVRTELRNALVYPMFLVGFGTLAVLFIFLVVVPRFAVAFKGRFDQIPWLSYWVIVGGMWMRGHLLVSGLAVAAVAVAAIYLLRQPDAGDRLLRLLGRVPGARDWLVEIETARWAAVLARLLENRVPLMQSLELARTALKSADIQLRLAQVERNVRTGAGLARALDDHRFLPTTALSLVRVGERSGNLPEMMRSVASIYDDIVRNRLKAILSIIEPVAIVLIGGVIGVVAVAIFLAITSINKVPGL